MLRQAGIVKGMAIDLLYVLEERKSIKIIRKIFLITIIYNSKIIKK